MLINKIKAVGEKCFALRMLNSRCDDPRLSVSVVKQCSYERIAVFRHGELTKRVVTLQTYYQRALACKDYKTARLSSILSAVASIFLSLPPAFIGVIGAATGEKGSWGPRPVRMGLGATTGEKRSWGPLQVRRGHGGHYR